MRIEARAPGRGPWIRACIRLRGGSRPLVAARFDARRPAGGETMSPAPRTGERSATTVGRCRTSREQAARRRARPIHSIRDALGPRRVGTSTRPRVRGLASRLQATARTDGEKASERRSPGRQRRPFPPRGDGGRTHPLRDGRPEGDPSGGAPSGAATGRDNVRRAGAPRGVPARSGEKALEGEAQGRSGTSVSAGPAAKGREGGTQTPDAAARWWRDPPPMSAPTSWHVS
jgi:hypothetical protein